MNVGLRTDQAQAELAARGLEGRHPMNQAHPAARKRQRIVQIDAVEGRAERRREIASSQCIDLVLIEPRGRHRNQKRESSAAEPAIFIGSSSDSRDDPLARGQLLRA